VNTTKKYHDAEFSTPHHEVKWQAIIESALMGFDDNCSWIRK